MFSESRGTKLPDYFANNPSRSECAWSAHYTHTMLNVDQVISSVQQLPSLPAVVLELIENLDDDDIGAGMLANKLARDQALTAKALRLANSSFYGFQGGIATIQEAIVVLGTRTVKTLTTAAAVTNQFPQ